MCAIVWLHSLAHTHIYNARLGNQTVRFELDKFHASILNSFFSKKNILSPFFLLSQYLTQRRLAFPHFSQVFGNIELCLYKRARSFRKNYYAKSWRALSLSARVSCPDGRLKVAAASNIQIPLGAATPQ